MQQTSSRARVYWVATGVEALEFLRQQARFRDVGPVQIVVLDLHLPGKDGFEVLREIKSDPILNRKPVILFTSSTLRDEIDLAYSLGANAYFSKPMTLQLYTEKVRVIAQHWLDLVELPTAGRTTKFSGFLEPDEITGDSL